MSVWPLCAGQLGEHPGDTRVMRTTSCCDPGTQPQPLVESLSPHRTRLDRRVRLANGPRDPVRELGVKLRLLKACTQSINDTVGCHHVVDPPESIPAPVVALLVEQQLHSAIEVGDC